MAHRGGHVPKRTKARQEGLRKQAEARAAERAARSTQDQLALIAQRRGESKRERQRLLA